MKKITLFITIILILTGCQEQPISNNINTDNQEISTNTKEEETIETDNYVDNNPIKVALYENNNIVKSYATTLGNKLDIASFDIYYTDKEKVDGYNTKSNYLKYYNEYENIENYKNGFYITFEADGNKIEQLILDPSAMYSMAPYLYVYLYDDINQEVGTYYSHLLEENMNDSTVISSIKLFLAKEGTKITSPISLTVFTYDSDDDFTEDNKYRGTSSYTIEIQTK